MSWTTLHLTVVTPLFSGDDPARETGSPVRVPSIRGALRFWFRAVAAGHGVTDLKELFRQEEEVFGSTARRSRIALRVREQPLAAGRGSRPDWATYSPGRRDRFCGAQYLLGQGLWSYRDGLTRDYVHPGRTFDLDVRFGDDETVNGRFMLALWAWLTYGGLGARTRRGFGQLACARVTAGRLPGRWREADLTTTRTAGEWAALGERAVPTEIQAKSPLGDWRLLEGQPDEAEPLPEFPVLAPRWWFGRMLHGTPTSLDAALDLAGREWRAFRAVVDPGGPIGDDTRSPEWRHVIHGDETEYPIAALGLPVGYYSAKRGRGPFKATVEPALNGAPLRRASPVWLRPVFLGRDRTGRETWGVFTHAFWARLLPDGADLRMTGSRTRDLPAPDEATVERAVQDWCDDHDRLPRNFYPRP
ncbi:type III-B CRISPR module RAMP protein Cmr1 [Gandjariella thermophila]|uniref:Type III-B CRISPR module RAMP protein Cmr1 n=1 Tax=Gandjariella thermophila TaxID=1931992 RepID=A0A4D4IXY8_9PSEU|nr:type III-B CRISPR module RAMP protein Cmr1 [Gandjariella thermophila]GDY29091.1 type III-B CRISPR module RAMP protein Cmr1 [Gandjariella thermophila]